MGLNIANRGGKRSACKGEKLTLLTFLNRLYPPSGHAAGIDIGSRSHWVCAGSGLTQEFPAHTEGLYALVAWLHQHQVTTVAMESTGVYWIPLYELLEAEGFEALLVDPS